MDGAPFPAKHPHLSRALGIAAIYQQPALFPDLTVAENIALATRSKACSTNRLGPRAATKLSRVAGAASDPHIDPDAIVSSLSMPEQQIVEIAKALGTKLQRSSSWMNPPPRSTDREVAQPVPRDPGPARAGRRPHLHFAPPGRTARRSPIASPYCATDRSSRPATWQGVSPSRVDRA